MISSIEDLLKINAINGDLSNIMTYTLASTRPDLILKSKRLTGKISIFSPLEEQHKSTWKYEDFDYSISSLGFRGQDLIDDIELAAFGCSYTFGQGLPEHRVWHKLLSEKYNLRSYNFGQPGASIKSIVDMFLILSNNLKIKKAVFLFPNYMRQLIAAKNNSGKEIKLLPLMPNYKGKFSAANFELQHDMFFKYVPDVELIKRMKDDLYHLEFMAKYKNIKVYISSWDRPTYDLMKLMQFDHIALLPEWTAPDDLNGKSDLARDMLHPGINHHKYWADQIEGIVCK